MAKEDSSDIEFGERATFGARLRRLREAAGLTQEELAGAAGLSSKAISLLERGERRHPHPHTVRSLVDALELSDHDRATFVAAASGGSIPKPALDTTVVTTLPEPPTPLVGREREVDEIDDLIGQETVRVLTVTGTGGVGKTRLALQAAGKTARLFRDGVVFVALAPLKDATLVLPTIARSLGLREPEDSTLSETLEGYLRERRLLLVLDNFEHVLDAASEVAGLIGICPELFILATSRAPLRIRGEREYLVLPLALPASTHSPAPEEILASPSGCLFVERASAASPGFAITDINAAAVATICWRLAGIPLALEIAAAGVRFLDPAALLTRLDSALSSGWVRDLPERQRTMRSTLDWSHGLLDREEKVLFRRLAVFSGGFTLEAAEAVGASPGDTDREEVFASLSRLVDQSLVMVANTPDGSPLRYGMLEPIRQYALQKLEETDEAAGVHEGHATFFLEATRRTAPESSGYDQASWLGWMETELDNLRAAIWWSIDHGKVEEVSLMAWAAWIFWWLRRHLTEGRRWAEATLASGGDELPAQPRARLLFVAAVLAQGQYDWEPARLMAEESLTLFQRLEDRRGTHYALGVLGLVAVGQGRHEEGSRLLDEAVELGLETGERRSAGMLLGYGAAIPLAQGDILRARQLAQRALSLAREVGPEDGIYVALHTLAKAALIEEELERAESLFREGLTLSSASDDRVNVDHFLEDLAAVAVTEEASTGDLIRAVRLWGAAEAIRETTEVVAYTYALDRSLHHERLAEARARLDEELWTEAWQEGRAMKLEEAVAYALSEEV